MGQTTSQYFDDEEQTLLIGEWPLQVAWAVKRDAAENDKKCAICKEPATRVMDHDNTVFVCDNLHGIPSASTSCFANDRVVKCDYAPCQANAIARLFVPLFYNRKVDVCWDHLFEYEKVFPALARVKEIVPDYLRPADTN